MRKKMKKRAADNNKSIRKVKKDISLLMKDYPDASFDFRFKKGKRTGSHCYLLNIQTPVGEKNINVIKTRFLLSTKIAYLAVFQCVFRFSVRHYLVKLFSIFIFIQRVSD